MVKIGGGLVSNTFSTSGHVKWRPESLYDPNLTMDDVTARLQGVGQLEDYQILVGTTHIDGEDSLIYAKKEVSVGQSPEGSVNLVSRAPVIKGGLVAKYIDRTPVYVEDEEQMTEEIVT